ncbi:MAG: hypothetical protein KI786_19640 [Mameliella sp.]|nr:hypothetical protein [Phaeodactylibacter sp.]NRA50233.1 hypothetical protein [Phaeodactylibacter sp.]
MKKVVKNSAFAILAVTALSSCNRGYGCPNNFSLNDALTAVVDTVITVINFLM